MAKADGEKIVIEFTKDLIGDVSGNESAFTVTFQEYDATPGGSLREKTVTAISTELYEDDPKKLLVTFGSGNLVSFRNAVGTVAVHYQNGTLSGVDGPVATFTETFTPEDLVPKNNVNEIEHLELQATVTGTLTHIDYTDFPYQQENLELHATVQGVLINVGDL